MKIAQPVVVHRINIVPDETPNPILTSSWIAVGIHTETVLFQAPNKEELYILLTKKGHRITKVLNDWN